MSAEAAAYIRSQAEATAMTVSAAIRAACVLRWPELAPLIYSGPARLYRKTCFQCGAEFEAYRPSDLYCRPACRRTGLRERAKRKSASPQIVEQFADPPPPFVP